MKSKKRIGLSMAKKNNEGNYFKVGDSDAPY